MANAYTDFDYQHVLMEAHTAAKIAVRGAELGYDDSRGNTGHVWVTVGGTTGFGRWCAKVARNQYSVDIAPDLIGHLGYAGGWRFNNPGGYTGQRLDIKEAGGKAFRQLLATYGIKGDVTSRLT